MNDWITFVGQNGKILKSDVSAVTYDGITWQGKNWTFLLRNGARIVLWDDTKNSVLEKQINDWQ